MKKDKNAGVSVDDSMDATIEIEPLDPEQYEQQIAATRAEDGDTTGTFEQPAISEVDPSLQPLREKLVSVQSQVALQSETILLLESDLKSSSNLIRHLESELTEKTTTLELQSSELDKRQGSIDRLTTRNEDLESAVSTLKTDLAIATETAGHAKARLDNKLQDIEALRSKHGQELDRGKALEQQIATLEGAQRMQDGTIADLNKEIVGRDSEIEKLRQEIANKDSHASVLDERLNQRANQISEQDAKIAAHASELSQAQNEALDLQQAIKALEVDLAKRDETITDLQTQVSTWRDKFNALEATVAKRDTQISKIEAELAEYHTKIKDRDSMNASLVSEQEQASKEITDLQARVQEQADTLVQRDSRIHELEADKKADERQIAALESELQAKTDTIQSRTSAIEAQHQTIKVLDQKNVEFQRQSDSMYESLRRSEKRVAELESLLATKDTALSTIQLGILKLSEFGAKPTSKRPKPNKKQPNISVVYQEPPEKAESEWFLVNLDGQSKTRYPLHKSPITVGRGRANDIQIKNDFISGYHAEFVIEDDGVKLKDLGSTNATRVNAKRIEDHPLKHGDIIAFGELRFEFVDANKGSDETPRVARLK